MNAYERVRLDPEAATEGDLHTFVAIKVNPDGQCALAHRLAETGPTPSGAVVWLVTDVPDVVTALEVLELFAATVGWRRGWRVRFAEIGPGRLVR